MSLTEFDQEEYDRNRRREGEEEGILRTAQNLLAMELLSPEQIARATGLPLEDVHRLSEELAAAR